MPFDAVLNAVFSPIDNAYIALTGKSFLQGNRDVSFWRRKLASGSTALLFIAPEEGAITSSAEEVGAGDAATFSRAAGKWADHARQFPEFQTEAQFTQNAFRLAAADQSADILVETRASDGTTLVYERSTGTIVYVHPNGDIGSQYKPRGGEAYFWKKLLE